MEYTLNEFSLYLKGDGNDAVRGSNDEVVRQLRAVADRLEQDAFNGKYCEGICIDVNGNSFGNWFSSYTKTDEETRGWYCQIEIDGTIENTFGPFASQIAARTFYFKRWIPDQFEGWAKGTGPVDAVRMPDGEMKVGFYQLPTTQRRD